VTAVEIIEEIKRLPQEDQTKVIDFARRMRQLSPEQLGELAKRMVESKNPAEADWLEKELIRGFYGDAADA
jgi:hypothetical protein